MRNLILYSIHKILFMFLETILSKNGGSIEMDRVTSGTILFSDSEKQLYYNRLRLYEKTGLEPKDIDILTKLEDRAIGEYITGCFYYAQDRKEISMKRTKYGKEYDVVHQIDQHWNNYDKSVASAHLTNYGLIYIDEYGQPIDNEYDLEEIE